MGYETTTKLTPKQRHHCVLTLLSTALDLERVAMMHVNNHVMLFDVLSAKGGFDEEEHKANIRKISQMDSFLDRLKDYNPKNDLRLNVGARRFKERKNENIRDVLNEIIRSKKGFIAYPHKCEMSLTSNDALFRFYSAQDKDYVPVFLVPLIGTDKEVYMILGGSNPFSGNGFDKIFDKVEDVDLLYGIISGTLQKERAYEKIFDYKETLTTIDEIVHQFRNDVMALGGWGRFIVKRMNEDGEIDYEKIKMAAEAMNGPDTQIEEALDYIVSLFKAKKETRLIYINDVVEDAKKDSTHKKIKLYLDKGIPYARGDPNTLKGMLLNIIEIINSTNGSYPIDISTRPKTTNYLDLEGTDVIFSSEGITMEKQELSQKVKKSFCNGEANPRFGNEIKTEIGLCNGGDILVEGNKEIKLHLPGVQYS